MAPPETTGADPTIYYLHGLGLVAQSDGTATEYFAYDGLGSVRQLADSSGDVLLTQTFDPYGNPYESASTAGGETHFGFTGEMVDANGLVFLRARYYNPAQGRFLNMDPSHQEMNPYWYGFGNPVNYVDPSGYLAQSSIDCNQWPTYLKLRSLCQRANVPYNSPDALVAREELYRTFVKLGIAVWAIPKKGGDSFLAAAAMLSHFLDGGGSHKSVSPDVKFANDPGIVRATRGFGGPVGVDTNSYGDDPVSLIPLLVLYIQKVQIKLNESGTYAFNTPIDVKSSEARYSNSRPRAVADGYFAAYGHVKIDSSFTSTIHFSCRSNGYIMRYKADYTIKDRYEWFSGKTTPFYVPQKIRVPHDWALSLADAARANMYDFTMTWTEKGKVWISPDFSEYKFLRQPFEGYEPDPWSDIDAVMTEK